MRRLLRVVRVGIGLLLLLVVVLAGSVAGLLWATLPPAREATRVPGLRAAADVSFDADGIARIRAASPEDGAAALGYVHARDRMFQMELMRRAASGRLSEIAGGATLRLDRMMRVLGLRRRAEAELPGLPPEARALLDAYARGVNAFIAGHGRLSAPEFALLGAPEPWTPTDSLLWGWTMGVWLSGNWRVELARAALPAALPAGNVDELWPPTVAVQQQAAAGPLPGAATLLAALPAFPAPFTWPPSASDEWAVDGSRSATGAPLLAGDPHLGFSMPGVWYLARIETPAGVLAGATAPGVPFLVMGHNGRVAWTFTTNGADTQDLFTETVLPDGRYATPDGPRAFDTRTERIRVRGAADDVLTVRETRHGPVVSDLLDAPGPVLAAAMANLAPDDDAAAGLLALNRAADADEAGRAAALIRSPVQNLLVADRGRIARFTTGRVPVRRAGDGSRPVPGADGAHDWTGWAEGAALPRAVAPASGVLLNGNDRVAPPDFPVFMGRDWVQPWRAQRIAELLDRRGLAPADFAAMQVDAVSTFARRVLPALLAAAPSDGPAARAAALLRGWDGTMAADAPQPLVFEAWAGRFHDLVLRSDAAPFNVAGPWPDVVAYVLSPAGAHWCGGDCGPLLSRALTEATAALSARFGPDPARWRWGDAHQAVFAHPILGSIPVLRDLATWRVPVPGSDTTLFRGGTRPGGFESVHGAGFRGVYDLSDLDRSLFMAAPGQSGHPLSVHAADLLPRWRRGDTVFLGPRPDRIEASLRLDP